MKTIKIKRNIISQHINCSKCFADMQSDNLVVGVNKSKDKLQVWCDKCDTEVITFDLGSNLDEKTVFNNFFKYAAHV